MMRQKLLLSPTLREAQADAETASHQFLLRAGMIRQLAAGVYTYLPLGYRVLQKVSNIIREELDAIQAQEMLMPAMQPSELWHKSGRYEVYGPELIRFHDRHEREFALGPTHEEVITSLIQNEISSYRQLPLAVYQIQTKFRDERRPRSGLLRGREFLMTDVYSFHADFDSLDRFYEEIHGAYMRIFDRCGLVFRGVQADAGAIGGEGGSHEFIALSDIGEDTIAVSDGCDYAANLEKAEVRLAAAPIRSEEEIIDGKSPLEKFHTPNLHTIDELVEALDLKATQLIKTLVYTANEKRVAVLVRGDREVNEIKVKQALGATDLTLADASEVMKATGARVGFAGPVGLNIPLLVDQEVARMSGSITGANEDDYHLRHVLPGRDFSLDHIGDFRNAADGDLCPNSEGTLSLYRGIEIGHIFKLGDKYSSVLGASFLNADGQSRVPVMGCYGIGVSRLMAAIVEQSHDEHGIIWPASVAPYQVHLIPISVKDTAQMELAEELYQQLSGAGVEVLLDDRDERPGVKFKDADLIGIPFRIVVGKGASEGTVEVKKRAEENKQIMQASELTSFVANHYI